MRGNLAVRSVVLVLGLFVFSAGIVSIYESELGLSPWDVLNQGISEHTRLSFGTANIVDRADHPGGRRQARRAGAGRHGGKRDRVGAFVDLLLRIDAVDGCSDNALGVRIVLLVGGIAISGLAPPSTSAPAWAPARATR